MKKILCAVLSLIMVLSLVCGAMADQLSDIQAKGKLVVGASVAFPPYEFYFTNPETNQEEYAGFDMELAKGIAAKLGVEGGGAHTKNEWVNLATLNDRIRLASALMCAVLKP